MKKWNVEVTRREVQFGGFEVEAPDFQTAQQKAYDMIAEQGASVCDAWTPVPSDSRKPAISKIGLAKGFKVND